MNIAVVLRQVPDLIEPPEVDPSGTKFDLGAATFILNESDDHALEQALLMKEAGGGTITVLAFDFGDVDNTLYTAAAKGADRIVKLLWQEADPPTPHVAAAMLAEAIRPLRPELVLVGVNAHNELDGVLPPFLAQALAFPYIGVIRGVQNGPDPGVVSVRKEFPGAVMAQLQVQLPAVLGILGAEQPPRYVPVSRIRAATKTAQFEETEPSAAVDELPVAVRRLYPPAASGHAEMLTGSADEIAARIMTLLADKGILK
jgi:electron transfer flavoprotein beta subunit